MTLQTGCTALLGSSGLQEMLTETNEPSVTALYDAEEDPGAGDAVTTDMLSTDDTADAVDPDTALDEAVQRLSDSGRLDTTTQDALEAALEDAPRQDWPAIIDAFVATIEASPRPRRTVLRPVDAVSPEPPIPEPTTADDEPAATEQDPPAEPAREPVPSTAAVPPATEEPAPAAPRLAVANACFASRVRGWGAVDRFTDSQFRPGQELIVYFELEHLSAAASAAGHTTQIDTTLQLVAADGRRLHDWRFEPVAETCSAPRRDYFARYVLRIPDDASPGSGRLELAVTDTVGRCTASASLPLEIVGR